MQLLEDGFKTKMQAEMLVLVDVLHKPALVFKPTVKAKQSSDDRQFVARYLFCQKMVENFIGLKSESSNKIVIKTVVIIFQRLINHAKYLRDKQDINLCIKILQLLRKMIPSDDEVLYFFHLS